MLIKRVLITGACGTIGKVLLKKLSKSLTIQKIYAIDNDESKIFYLKKIYKNNPKVTILLIDLNDHKVYENYIGSVDTIYHLAAYKHVLLCEQVPENAIKNNINTLINLVDYAVKKKIKNFIFTSSDKAANPTNVMGTTKLLGEKIIINSNFSYPYSKTNFYIIRFGNVLGSSGSVLDIFKKQIDNNQDLTLNSNEMTRFIMSIDEAVNFILSLNKLIKPGEILIPKMKSILINDLANVVLDNYKNKPQYRIKKLKIRLTQIDKGEKYFEELFTESESFYIKERKKYFILNPNSKIYFKNKIPSYKSSLIKKISLSQIKDFLTKNKYI